MSQNTLACCGYCKTKAKINAPGPRIIAVAHANKLFIAAKNASVKRLIGQDINRFVRFSEKHQLTVTVYLLWEHL